LGAGSSPAPECVIRKFESGDAEEVSRLIIDDLLLVNVVDYGEAAVKQMAFFYSPDWVLRYAQSGETYVAALRSEIVGTVTLDQERARSLFVRIDQQRQGIGKLLMHHIEEAARRRNNARMVLLANVAAMDFYRNLGYVQGENREIEVGGARMTVVAMEKVLRKP
jgi:GNAT superfamily N-acetyltransferase